MGGERSENGIRMNVGKDWNAAGNLVVLGACMEC